MVALLREQLEQTVESRVSIAVLTLRSHNAIGILYV